MGRPKKKAVVKQSVIKDRVGYCKEQLKILTWKVNAIRHFVEETLEGVELREHNVSIDAGEALELGHWHGLGKAMSEWEHNIDNVLSEIMEVEKEL